MGVLAVMAMAGCAFPTSGSGTGSTGGGQTTDVTCREQVDSDLIVSTTWTDGEGCDYFVDGYIEVDGTLIIEPGVHVQFGQGATLSIEGQLVAVGEPDARIRLQGANPTEGYWNGLVFGMDARPSRIEYVDIADAGEENVSLYDPPAAISGFGGTTSFEHVTVSNSYVSGALFQQGRLEPSSFLDVAFFGNVEAGLLIDPDLVGKLDPDSDYLGEEEPNGVPYVVILPGTLERRSTWPALKVPYLASFYLDVDGDLTLEPGVELQFPADGSLVVQEGGSLHAVGTASDPIVLTGVKRKAGYWEGLWFLDSASPSELKHVEVGYGGGRELLQLEGAVQLSSDATLTISHTTIHDSAQWGLFCDDYWDGWLSEGAGNTFADDQYGGISPGCG